MSVLLGCHALLEKPVQADGTRAVFPLSHASSALRSCGQSILNSVSARGSIVIPPTQQPLHLKRSLLGKVEPNMSNAISNLNELAQLTERVSVALASNPYLRTRSIDFEANDGHVKLQGEVRTFFQKQMVQEQLRSVQGVKSIENQIQVEWA